MSLFKSIQKSLAMLGIKLNQPNPILKYIHPFNERNSIIICLFGGASVSFTLHLFEDLSFEEYIISAFATTTAIVNTIDIVILVWKTSKIFEFIKDIEYIVQISE